MPPGLRNVIFTGEFGCAAIGRDRPGKCPNRFGLRTQQQIEPQQLLSAIGLNCRRVSTDQAQDAHRGAAWIRTDATKPSVISADARRGGDSEDADAPWDSCCAIHLRVAGPESSSRFRAAMR